MPDGMEFVIEHLSDMMQRLEEKVDRLQTGVSDAALAALSLKDDITGLKEDIAELKADQSRMSKVVDKWKTGAAAIFAAGGVAVWFAEHWVAVKKFLGF